MNNSFITIHGTVGRLIWEGNGWLFCWGRFLEIIILSIIFFFCKYFISFNTCIADWWFIYLYIWRDLFLNMMYSILLSPHTILYHRYTSLREDPIGRGVSQLFQLSSILSFYFKNCICSCNCSVSTESVDIVIITSLHCPLIKYFCKCKILLNSTNYEGWVENDNQGLKSMISKSFISYQIIIGLSINIKFYTWDIYFENLLKVLHRKIRLIYNI